MDFPRLVFKSASEHSLVENEAEMQEKLKKGYFATVPESLNVKVAQPKQNELRQDGPTLDEYVKAGYLAENYPPKGYAAREAAKPANVGKWGKGK